LLPSSVVHEKKAHTPGRYNDAASSFRSSSPQTRDPDPCQAADPNHTQVDINIARAARQTRLRDKS
jgi:hypothetical protein